MTTLKTLTASLLLLIGIHAPAWAEGPAPLPFDSQGFSDSGKQKPATAPPTTPSTTVAVKEEPKKAARDAEEENDTQRVKKCEKVPAQKAKGKKAGPAKTICKTLLVKQKATKGQSRSNDEEASQPICKKGKRCHPPEAANVTARSEEKVKCKKGRKCKASQEASTSNESKKKATKPHSTKKKK